MNESQLKNAYDKSGLTDYGLFLGSFITGVLKNSNLSALQDSSLEAANKADGTYKPATFDALYRSCIEVLGLISERKIESVITLLKRCPTPEIGNRLSYFINNKKCTKAAYFNKDKIKGKRTIKGYDTPIDIWELLSFDSFKTTGYAGTRGGEQTGKELFPDAYEEEERFEEPHTTPDYPEPKSQAPATPEPEVNDFGDDTGTEDYDEFKGHNEPSEPWVNRPKEDTDDSSDS